MNNKIYLLEKLYFYFFQNAHKHKFYYFCFRKMAGLLTAIKHKKRGNMKLYRMWLCWIVGKKYKFSI